MILTKNLMFSLLALSAAAAFGFDGTGLDAVRQISQSTDSLKYLGHATVKIKTSEGKVIYIDPYAGTDYADSADVVLVTHQHGDHNVLSLVKRKTSCVTITNAEAIVGGVYQSFTIGNIKIDAVAAYNANHDKRYCVGYVLEFSGIKLYHAGDTGLITEMAGLAARNLNYALLPMDGIYTMSPEQATQAAAQINAVHTIPIHTMPPPDTYSDAIVARFTVPSKFVVHPGETIALSAENTEVGELPARPVRLALNQNYPNPFNPTTTIEFFIPEAGFTTLKVYDMLGKEAAVLVERTLQPGGHRVEFDGARLGSGVYVYKLDCQKNTQYGRMLLLK